MTRARSGGVPRRSNARWRSATPVIECGPRRAHAAYKYGDTIPGRPMLVRRRACSSRFACSMGISPLRICWARWSPKIVLGMPLIS